MEDYQALFEQAREAAAAAMKAYEENDEAGGDELLAKAKELEARAKKMQEAAGIAAEPEKEPEPTKAQGYDIMTPDDLADKSGVDLDTAKAVIDVLASQKAGAGAFATGGSAVKAGPELGVRDFLIRVRMNDRRGVTKRYGDCWDGGAFKGLGFEEAYKDLLEGTGAAGGYTVPQQFVPELFRAVGEDAVVRPRAFIQPMRYNTCLTPMLDQTGVPSAAGKTEMYGGVIAHWTGEAESKTETEPDFLQMELKAHKLAGYTQASDELLADSAVGLEALLRDLFGRAVAYAEDYAFFRGTGVGQPLGILNSGALLTVQRNVANNVNLDDLSRMMRDFYTPSLSAGRGAWYINPRVLPEIVQLADAAGNVVWIPNARDGLPMRMFSMPIYWTEKLPALGSTGDVLLADMNFYAIGDRQMTTIAASEHYAFTSDLTTWRFVHRVDGQPRISAPFYRDPTYQHSPFVALHQNTT